VGLVAVARLTGDAQRGHQFGEAIDGSDDAPEFGRLDWLGI
jgi:hypothetical protein